MSAKLLIIIVIWGNERKKKKQNIDLIAFQWAYYLPVKGK